MLPTIGAALSLVLLGLYFWLLFIIWKAPFRALGVLVAGMAVHNFMLMVLLKLGTPGLLVRAIQSWKEGILLLLLVLVFREVWAVRRTLFRGWRPTKTLLSHLAPFDYIVAAFAGLVALYLLLPRSVMPMEGNLTQRVVSVRLLLLLPVLYMVGRFFWGRKEGDLIWTVRVLLGSAAFVGLFGLWELWFVPTRVWPTWGIYSFTSWLGYSYHGLQNLPENFYQSMASTLALRRMVSTYISPLGIAYTALLLAPLSIGLLQYRRSGRELPGWFRWSALALLIVSVAFSVTRGAMVSFVGEALFLAVLLRGRRTAAVAVLIIAVLAFILYDYSNFGPLVASDLSDARPPVGYSLLKTIGIQSDFGAPLKQSAPPGSLGAGTDTTAGVPGGSTSGELIDRTISLEDPSASGHIAALKTGVDYALVHPFGAGLGSAVPRYGTTSGPGESALLSIVGELGIAGGLLYGAMYILVIVYGALAFRRFSRRRVTTTEAQEGNEMLGKMFPLVALVGGLGLLPVMITSTIWGDFSVTFLFWWCAGLSVSMARLPLPAATPPVKEVVSPVHSAIPAPAGPRSSRRSTP